MTEHRVASHLGLAAADYDREIRRMIPGYEEMLREVVALLDDVLDSGTDKGRGTGTGLAPLVVDLGAGTGALAGAILDAIPRARALLVDIDPQMLEVATARLAPHGARVEVRRQRFEDPLPP